MSAKVTPELAQTLDSASEQGLVDVVVELEPDEAPDEPAGDRATKVAHRKRRFEEHATPVHALIESLGGEVVDKAWINRTIRARMPARAVPELAQAGAIASLDEPHRLTAE